MTDMKVVLVVEMGMMEMGMMEMVKMGMVEMGMMGMVGMGIMGMLEIMFRMIQKVMKKLMGKVFGMKSKQSGIYCQETLSLELMEWEPGRAINEKLLLTSGSHGALPTLKFKSI